ncbi:MAG: hypothetical protein LBB83_01505 [Treponema sp.]|jgi:hypothetical protein|nr:hypothetical protein [Treponema sp.]
MSLFEKKTAAGDTAAAGNTAAAGDTPAGSKKWRAKNDCIYRGAYTRAGTVVAAADMRNVNFEEVP